MTGLGQRGRRVSSLLAWFRRVGVRSTVQRITIRTLQNLGLARSALWNIRPRQARYPLKARLRGSSDEGVFHQIFTEEEYLPLKSMKNVALVVDLGATVGYSSAYFLSCFEKARLVAVEPDAENLKICRTNLKPYGDRVLLLHGAAWSECTKLCISPETLGDGREWGRQVKKPSDLNDGFVQAWDVATLIDKSGLAEIDLLKVDIERAELEVFGESAKTWLPRVRNICIELHGPDCEKRFFEALSDFDFELQNSGELTICRDIQPKRVQA
jgi:FkbM family methyltransferase